MERPNQESLVIHLVESTDSPEFTLLTRALPRSSVIGLDAEWKPVRSEQSEFPTVSLIQLVCQLGPRIGDKSAEPVVFLLDLATISLPSIWGLLRAIFVNPDILKLGFRFKQDLVFLSSTFCAQGCEPGFDRVEPYLDITSVYRLLQRKMGKNISNDVKSLATICAETVGIFLSKELQCSDWSHRPLTEEQKIYAAKDAYCLLRIFEVLRSKVVKEGLSCYNDVEMQSDATLGLKEILDTPASGNRLLGTQCYDALDIVVATAASEDFERVVTGAWTYTSMQYRDTLPMEESLWKIVKKYGEKIHLLESDKRRKTSKKKGKRQNSSFAVCKEKQIYDSTDWQGPPPWDSMVGGDGYPKFLCDVMVEGLAKHLRCVGIDAAIPSSKKPEPRELIDQVCKEKRVLLTRDAKLLRHQYLVKNQIYKVKSLLKNEQLLEVIKTFQLQISEDQLMSRCTKCNGRFIQKPLTTEEAVEAAKGFQKIPDCLFNKNLEFWQCMDCSQLYWEGTQYHNAVQKFIDVCRLNE